MAYLRPCEFCGQSSCDSPYHANCFSEHMEGLLAKLSDHIKKGKGKDLPKKLKEAITGRQWRTEDAQADEAFQRQVEEGEERLRALAKSSFLQAQADEWERKNPSGAQLRLLDRGPGLRELDTKMPSKRHARSQRRLR